MTSIPSYSARNLLIYSIALYSKHNYQHLIEIANSLTTSYVTYLLCISNYYKLNLLDLNHSKNKYLNFYSFVNYILSLIKYKHSLNSFFDVLILYYDLRSNLSGVEMCLNYFLGLYDLIDLLFIFSIVKIIFFCFYWLILLCRLKMLNFGFELVIPTNLLMCKCFLMIFGVSWLGCLWIGVILWSGINIAPLGFCWTFLGNHAQQVTLQALF